jgi:hypothetical protein
LEVPNNKWDTEDKAALGIIGFIGALGCLGAIIQLIIYAAIATILGWGALYLVGIVDKLPWG